MRRRDFLGLMGGIALPSARDKFLFLATDQRGNTTMVEKRVPYEVDGRPFEGVLVYDDSVKTKRPAVFSQPDWKGVCTDTISQARTIAGKDFVVMLADMYGVGYGDKPKGYPELMAGMKTVY